MLRPYTLYLCPLMIALVWIHTTTANLNMNNLCALVNNGQKIASYNACDVYYTCQNGVATLKSCSRGKYFDKEIQSCLPQNQVKCLAASSVPCSGYKIGSWAPVIGSCSDYYYCSAKGPKRSKCPEGQYFNPNKEICVYPDQYPCRESEESMESSQSSESSSEPCSGYDTGSWAPVAGSCSDFYYCSAKGAERSSCPKGQHFNPNKEICVYPNQYPCTESEESSQSSEDSSDSSDYSSEETSDSTTPITLPLNLCNFFKNYMFFGSSSSCSSWNKCINNVMETGSCPNGLLYNVLKMECDYAVEVTCSQVSNDPLLSAITCSTKNTMKAGESCNTYFVCDGSYFQLHKCSGGLFFDTISNSCVDRLEARNDCDRCLGSSQNFVNAYSDTNCRDYLYCKNGVEVTSGTCPNDGYFDERTGSCLMSHLEPLLGCCNPAYFTNDTSSKESSSEDSGSGNGSNESSKESGGK